MDTIGLSGGARVAPVRAPPAPPARVSQQPCLPDQRRTWLLGRMDPGSPALNIAVRWRVAGRLPGTDLEQAVARIVARHPALRTFIVEVDGVPMQVVEPVVPLHIPDIDLTGMGEAEARAQADRIAQQHARAPFDLSAPPLIRVTRLRLHGDASLILLTTHRMVCDAAWLDRLGRELETICAALSQGRAPALPEPPPANEAPVSDDARRGDEAHWVRSLRGLRPFELPTDRARPPAQTSNGAIVSRQLDRAVIDGLRAVARRHDGTLYTAALAALLALLQRYSGEDEIVIGSQASGDDAAAPVGGVERFVNTIVVRADLSGAPTLADLLVRVRDIVVEDFKHQGTPLGRVIELLAPERDLSRPALFSVHFTFQGGARDDGNPGVCRWVDEPACAAGARYELDFSMVERAEGWHLSCEFNSDLYEPETAGRLLDHFINLLRAVATDPPSQPIGTMALLGEDERRSLSVDCNRTEAFYPQHLTAPRLFEAQVERTPDALALVCGEQRLSYRELDRAANRLAHELQGRGIARGSRIGICLARSPDLVVALLAVLKAGAAYVPLDPAYPAARLAQIVADAQPALLLTHGALRPILPAGAVPCVLLDGEAPAIARQRDAPPGSSATPEDAAYVIYTSGSTGRPKGVQIPHRALTNLLWSMRSQPGLASSDILLAVTTVSFDIAALELFLPLIVGATLVVARDDETGDGAALRKLLHRHGATVLQATPVTWQILLASGWRGDPPLKMLCGGETLPRTLADALLAQGGELWNLYGPTETTIWSSALRVRPGAGPVPIGPPIANTQFYVLDAHGQPVPAGVPGELYIGGDGVALGYVNLPELTRERFVPDVFRRRAGGRLYRTGDRVRRKPGGEMEFLGRGDHQIKLRGYRIELGEIESVIRAHAQVADCVAIAGPDASGEAAVQAYVVAQRADPAAAAALVDSLRVDLRQALPAYMCPAVIVVLPALPRMRNGKVDRAALRVPLPAPPASARRPANALEQRLARLWSAVLGIPDVGVDSNFFEVGGHSLLAVRLLARIEAEFGQRLSLAALFGNPTVAGQARLLEHGDARAFDFRQVVKLQAGGSRPPLIALNNTGIYYALSRRLGPDQPFTSLQLFDPALPRAALPRTLQDIAAEYAQLIRRVQRTGPYALLGWCVAGTLAFEVARQLRGSGQDVSRLILFDTLAPGHLRRLPWAQALLADYAYRWQLIAADWARARRGRHAVASFLANRTIVMKLQRLLRRALGRAAAPIARDIDSRQPTPPLSAAQYDQWLLHYLEDAASSYQPESYAGSMTLFRSSQEPAGRFLDPRMGWGRFVERGIEVTVIEGDHFSIFQEPSVSQMAQCIEQGARAP